MLGDSEDIINRIDRLADSIDKMVELHGDMVGFYRYMIKALLIVVCAIALGKELLGAVTGFANGQMPTARAESK